MPVHERPHSRYRLAWGGRPRTMFSISHGVAFVQGVELSVCQPRRMSQPPIDPTQPPSAPHARSAITRSAPSGSNSAGRVSASQAWRWVGGLALRNARSPPPRWRPHTTTQGSFCAPRGNSRGPPITLVGRQFLHFLHSQGGVDQRKAGPRQAESRHRRAGMGPD